jgi:lipopolysaccharide assembly outer membrane protein LptD (OstA)
MKWMNLFAGLSAIVLLTANFNYAAVADEKPLDLLHADRLLSSGKDVNNITNLIGNVHLKHGTTDLRASRAIWYKKTDVVVFIDSVRVVDGLRILTCKNLTYYRKSGSANAVGEVMMRDDAEKVILTATKVDYLKDEERFVAVGAPLLTFFPEDDSARTVIDGDSIIYNTNLKTGKAINYVTITRRDMVATCDTALFYESGEKIRLLGEPLVTQNRNELMGEEIELQTKNKTLVEIVVNNKANAIYRNQPDTSLEQFTEATLEGKQLEAYFLNDKLTKAVMHRNAVSHYIPAATDTITRGRNTASGDSITLFFGGSGINRVLIIGGARGHYVEQKAQSDGEIKSDTTYYEASEIDYLVDEKLIELFNHASLKYQTMTLESGQIRYDIDAEIMIAEGIVEQSDSGEVKVQKPVLKEGKDELYGYRMVYNIETRRGKVELGETEFENGYYQGRELRQIEKDVLFVSSGEYTTCDKEYPHFHFYSHRMKMLAKDKVIARPVILFIGPLPVMIIPYYVFPIRKGRHSGFTTFQIGNIQGSNRFIRNFGYYWAASDYWDFLTGLDFYENRNVVINGNLRYVWRYRLSGNIKGSFARTSRWSNYKRDVTLGWGIDFSHNQTIDETTSLRAGGSFRSSKSYNIDELDQEERLQRTIRSNASLNKRWTSETITIAVDQTWNLDTDVKTRLLPTISFSRKQLPIFSPPAERKKNQRILPWEEIKDETKRGWYHSIYYDISSNFQNRHYYSKKAEILDWQKFKTLDSRFGLSSPQKIFGVFTFNPSVSIKQTVYKIDEIHVADSARADSLGLVTDDYFRREVWSAALSANTKLYGTFYPNFLYITGFRHVITPSASYNYAPKTERNQEYYEFTRVGSSSSRKRFMSFGLENLFQMKLGSGESERKFDLLSVSSSTSYDFEKDNKRWGLLSSSFRTGAIKIVDFSLSTVHDFYDENTGDFRELDPWLVSLSGSMSFSRTFTLGGGGGSKQGNGESKSVPDTESGSIPLKESKPKRGQETSLQVNLSHRYTERRSQGRVVSKTRWLSAAFDLQLTSSWNIKLDFQYDLEAKKTSYPKFELSRDLHCWKGEFSWRPEGPLKGYYFKIYIKQLPDIKIEQTVGNVAGSR